MRADDRADGGPARLERGHEAGLDARHVGQHRSAPRVGREHLGESGARAHGRGEDDRVGIPDRGRRIPAHAVDEPSLARHREVLRAAAEADDLGGEARLADRERERAADEPDARDREPLEECGRAHASTARSAATSRSFSAVVPTVTRTCSGNP